jgi:hypothetical protein
VTPSPREAEGGGAPGRAFALRGDQCRDGGEVVRIGGMAKAEHDRDGDHDEERRPVGEARDPVVEAEHLS